MGSFLIKTLVFVRKALEWDNRRQLAKAQEADKKRQAVLLRIDEDELRLVEQRQQALKAINDEYELRILNTYNKAGAVARKHLDKRTVCRHAAGVEDKIIKALKEV